MAIFHCYVSSPEGILGIVESHPHPHGFSIAFCSTDSGQMKVCRMVEINLGTWGSQTYPVRCGPRGFPRCCLVSKNHMAVIMYLYIYNYDENAYIYNIMSLQSIHVYVSKIFTKHHPMEVS